MIILRLLINNADDFNTVLDKGSDIKLGLVVLIDGEYINKNLYQNIILTNIGFQGKPLFFFDTLSKE